LTTFGNYLPAVQIQYQKLQNETYDLLSKKQQLETGLYELNTTIGSAFNMLRSIQIRCEEVERERNSLKTAKVCLGAQK
jgi:chaperonin cofactor prefoldin